MVEAPHLPQTVLTAYNLDPESIEPLSGGLINASFTARQHDGADCVLQRVNPIFPPSVQHDIEAVTQHLKVRGLTTPLLIRTSQGKLWQECNGEVWRLLTRVAGRSHETVTGTSMAREAGRILGSFHAALADMALTLTAARPPVHDLDRHIGHLRQTLAGQQEHPAHAQVRDIAERITALADQLARLPETPARLVHGDPKISNVIFDGGRAVCMIDLDTITHQPLPLELGDALRSWCNPEAEDSPAAHFSVERFKAVLAGYRLAAGSLFDPEVRRAVPDAALQIAVELASRFAADALNEAYFGWDQTRFASASEHNLARAGAQLALAESMREAMPDMRTIAVTQP